MLTTGRLLSEKREKLGLTLVGVERRTRIRKDKLEAVEESRWDAFPSKTYIIGVIRSYSQFLGLDSEKLIAFFRREYEKKEEDIHFKQRIEKKYLTPRTRKLVFLVSTVFILSFATYFGYQINLYLSPPRVTILKPKDDRFIREDKIELVGKAPEDSIIEINGEKVFQRDDHTFSIMIPLPEKKNKVTIKVTGANGKTTTVKKIFERKEK